MAQTREVREVLPLPGGAQVTTVPAPELLLPKWLVDAVLGLVATAYEAGKAEALVVEPEPIPKRDVHTRAEVAAILRTSRTTVDKLIREETLPSFTVASRRLVSDEDLRAYIQANHVNARQTI